MTFDDMDDVSLAAEYYMLSSQVDGEQDLIETTPKKPAPPVNSIPINIVNGIRQNGTPGNIIKVEPSINNTFTVNRNLGGNLIINGTNGGSVSDNSILARHLGVVTVRPTPVSVQSAVVTVPPPSVPAPVTTVETQDTTYSCEMCSAKLKNKRNFDTHMKRHRGELPFKCDECPKTFQGRRDLETHKRSRHDPGKKTILSVDNSCANVTPVTPQPVPISPAVKQKTIVLTVNSISNPLLQGLYFIASIDHNV